MKVWAVVLLWLAWAFFFFVLGHFAWPSYLPPQVCAKGAVLLMDGETFNCIGPDWRLIR